MTSPAWDLPGKTKSAALGRNAWGISEISKQNYDKVPEIIL